MFYIKLSETKIQNIYKPKRFLQQYEKDVDARAFRQGS